MTDDIVKRLLSQVGDDVQKIYDHEALFRGAAAEITALREQLAMVLQREADGYTRHAAKLDAAEAERDRLRKLLLSVADHIRPKQDRSGNGVVVAALHRAADEIAALTTGDTDERA
jgi:ATP-dependent protease HslVU (ClpYQ) peptidase subunit